jgi:hypothetical protein
VKQFADFENKVSKLIKNYQPFLRFFNYVNDLIIESRITLAYALATEYFIDDNEKFDVS